MPIAASRRRIAVRGNTIAFVGDDDAAREYIGEQTEIHELGASWFCPACTMCTCKSGRAHEISETRVLLTLFDGRVVFDRESLEASAQR
jgi:predicted amidohydrolase YtcJ